MLAGSVVHPVSHVDAWVIVDGSAAEVRLITFLDDVLRFQQPAVADDGFIEPADFREALARHAETLLAQIKVFDQQGVPLTGSVVSLPDTGVLPERIHPTGDAALRLTWKFRHEGETPLTALTVLPNLYHESLTTRAELRLHVKSAASTSRVDAVVFDRTSHTVVLSRRAGPPGAVAVRPERDVNAASVLLVAATDGVLAELTCPVAVLTATEPEDPGERTVAIEQWDASHLRQVAVELTDQFRRRVSLLCGNGESLAPSRVDVRYFAIAGGIESIDSEQLEGSVSPATLSIRASLFFSDPRQRDSATFLWRRAASGLQSADVTVMMSTGSRTETVPFQDGVLSVTLPTEFHAAQSAAFESISADAVPWRLKTVWPTTRSVFIMVISLTLVGVSVVTQGSGHARRVSALLCLLLAASAWLWFDSTTVRVPETAVARQVVKQLLTAAFTAASRGASDEVADQLMQVMEPELAESVFVGLRAELAQVNGEDAGLIIELTEPQLKNVVCRIADGTEDAFEVDADWTIGGRILHWGHLHSQQMACRGTIQVRRLQSDWRLQSVTLAESSVLAETPQNPVSN
jgi:hypothetical protein